MLYATLSAASLALSMSPMAALSSQSRVAAPVMSGVARNPNIEKLQVRAAAAAIRKHAELTHTEFDVLTPIHTRTLFCLCPMKTQIHY